MINTISQLIPSQAEKVMLSAGGVIGGALSFAFGDIGPLITWLAIFLTADLVSGIVAAVKRGEFKSSRLAAGMTKKGLMFSIVALAHGLDVLFSPLIGIQIFQSITICAYAAGEFGSVIENLERGGFGGVVPPVLRRLVATLEERVEAHADIELSKKGMKKEEKE